MQELAGGRILDLEGPTRCRRLPIAVDEELVAHSNLPGP
jgi:hypothetical protein